MPKDVIVTFKDGTTHTYQNAPDDITPDMVDARAQKEFGKPVASLSRGSAPVAPAAPPKPAGAVDTFLSDLTEPLRKGRETFARSNAPYEQALAAAKSNPNIGTVGNAVLKGAMAIPGDLGGAIQQGSSFITGPLNALLTKPFARGITAASEAVGLPSYHKEGDFLGFGGRDVQNTHDQSVNQWNDVINTGLGGVEGVPSAGRAPRPPAPVPLRVQRVRMLQDAGVPLTPGQIMGGLAQKIEDAAATTAAPIQEARVRGNDSLQTHVINDALAPIGQRVDGAGREAIGQMHEHVSNALNDAFDNANFSYDQQLHNDVGAAARGLLPSSRTEAGQITNEFLTDASQPGGLSEAFSNLTRMRQQASQRGDASLSEFIHNLQQSALDNMERNGGDSGAIRAARDAFRRSIVPETAAAKLGASEGVPSSDQLLSAVRGADRTGRKNAFARGEAQYQPIAEAAKDVMGRTIGSSGTAERTMLSKPWTILTVGARNLALRGVYNRPVINALNTISRATSAIDFNDALSSLQSLARLDPGAADALRTLGVANGAAGRVSPPLLTELPGMSAAANQPPQKKRAK